MISLIESYSEIIESYDIQRYRQYDKAYGFVATIKFMNNSELHVRDYFFLYNERKYSFHWAERRSAIGEPLG